MVLLGGRVGSPWALPAQLCASSLEREPLHLLLKFLGSKAVKLIRGA